MGEHARFEELAVAHVLGGLDEDASATFREHLLRCRICQARVAELRDLASDLAAAERHERASLRVKTETTPRREIAPAASGTGGRRFLGLALAGLAAVVMLGLMLWNFHLRGQNRTLLERTEVREDVLDALSRGAVMPTSFSRDVQGLVVADGQGTALALSGLPDLGPAERFVVWTVRGDRATAVRVYGATAPSAGRLAVALDDADATGLLVTIEETAGVQTPSDRVLVDATLLRGGS